MKIHIEHDSTTIDYETTPMPESRFKALCGIAYALIGAATFIGFFALFAAGVG